MAKDMRFGLGVVPILVYRGAIHIHSVCSDGAEDYEGIVSAASYNGLDFVIVTDHDTLGAGTEAEGWRQNVLLLIGAEISPARNHYLALGCTELPDQNLGPEHYVAAVSAQEGLGFVAHPEDRGSPYLGLKSYAWDQWENIGFEGIELWNFFSQWVGRSQTFCQTLIGVLAPGRYITGPESQTLARWDRLGRDRRIPGLAGIDAHGSRKFGWVPHFLASYRSQLATLHTYIQTDVPWTGSVDKDRKLVLDALRQGRCYLVNNWAGAAFAFDFWAQVGGKRIPMGGEIKREQVPAVTLRISAPGKAKIRLLRNGKEVRVKIDDNMKYRATRAGVYRAEVWTGRGWKKPWVFSNPIYLR